ncbi:MAG: phenylacetic acid degradation protein PaaN, partial [Bacteroidota bacterium]
KHKELLAKAIDAYNKRIYYTPYPEIPKAYSKEDHDACLDRFKKQHGQKFMRLKQDSDDWLKADENSPYTREDLNISYPTFKDVQTFIDKSNAAFEQWKTVDLNTRAGILVEAIERLKPVFNEIAYSTMHTTGQAYMMSFQASGPHAADRALEAVAIGYAEQTRFPEKVTWIKPMGKFDAKIEKEFVNVPHGLNLVIGCATFPVWNAVPGIFAGLITGNSVIVKPHPMSIYPIAVVVAELQQVLDEAGLDPNTILLAPDTLENPITKKLAEHDDVKLIDFTGGSVFGNFVESLPGKTTFTEKSGVNSVIIDSVHELNSVMKNLAFSVTLYSGQMCTAPQNFFIPEGGIQTADGHLPYDQVVEALAGAVKGLAGHEKAGPAIAGAVQRDDTVERQKKAKDLGAKVLLEPFEIQNPDFPKARTASPMILEVSAAQRALAQQEMFGPILFVIPTKDTDESLSLAYDLAKTQGALSCAAYSTDPNTRQKIALKMAEAHVPVAFNLDGQVHVNQNAGFSDFHGTGGNPAGNASFADQSFVNKRYTKIGFKLEAKG